MKFGSSRVIQERLVTRGAGVELEVQDSPFWVENPATESRLGVIGWAGDVAGATDCFFSSFGLIPRKPGATSSPSSLSRSSGIPTVSFLNLDLDQPSLFVQ